MPLGGGAISAVSGIIGSQIEKHEYNKFQNRMVQVTDVGTVEELTDVARQVARKLADCYRDQLLSLQHKLEDVLQVYCSCCPCFPRSSKDKSTAEEQPVKVVQSTQQIALVGVAFAVQGILDGKIENIQFSDDTKCEDLAKAITELICSAKPSIKAKVLRRLNIDKNKILTHAPLENSEEKVVLNDWYLYEFYRKPGIYIQNGEEPTRPLSWMNPVLYGYRLGTHEEYTRLDKIDKEQIENKLKSCCC